MRPVFFIPKKSSESQRKSERWVQEDFFVIVKLTLGFKIYEKFRITIFYLLASFSV